MKWWGYEGWRMKDEGWRMKDEGWGMRDEGWGMRDEGWRMRDEGWGMKDEGWGMKDEGWRMKDVVMKNPSPWAFLRLRSGWQGWDFLFYGEVGNKILRIFALWRVILRGQKLEIRDIEGYNKIFLIHITLAKIKGFCQSYTYLLCSKFGEELGQKIILKSVCYIS